MKKIIVIAIIAIIAIGGMACSSSQLRATDIKQENVDVQEGEPENFVVGLDESVGITTP